MQSALHQNAGAAERDGLVDLLADLFERADVRVRRSGPAIERAERTDYVADIRVIDVAIDDVGDDVIRMAARADLIGSDAHPGDVMRLEQRCAFCNGHALTREH